MMRRICIVLLVVLCSVYGNSQTVLENFFTEEGGNSPYSLNGDQKCGQRFTATQPFEGIEVNGPTWSVSGEKGMTVRLYHWAGNYESTVAQNPIVISVLVNLDDNGWFPVYAGSELAAGEYFWEASEPTNSNPEAENPYQIGCWLWNESKYVDGEAYFNGVKLDNVAITWWRLYGDGQDAVFWTPFSIPDSDIASLAQSFTVGWDFQGVALASPTWNGTGAGCRMSLYEWDTDYDTTIAGDPIAQTIIENHSDNARAELIMENPAPGGRYLVVSDQPVRGTGNFGHWGWTNSSWWDPENTTFADGIEMENYESFDLFIGEPSSEPIGKDFASRSLGGVATSIAEWELF